MTEMAVKINGPDTTRKAKLDGVLRNWRGKDKDLIHFS